MTVAGHAPAQNETVIEGHAPGSHPGPAVNSVTLLLLAGWAATLPFEPEAVWLSVGPVDLRTGQVLGLAVVVSFLAGAARSHRWAEVPAVREVPGVPALIRRAAALFALVLVVAPLWSGSRAAAAIAAGFRIGLGLSVAVIVARSVRRRRDTVLITRALAVGVVAAALVGLWAMSAGGEAPWTSLLRGSPTRLGLDPRLTRPFPHANLAAVFLAGGLPAVVWITRRWSGALRLVAPLVVATVTLAAALTYSRPVLVLPLVALAVGAVVSPAEAAESRWWWSMTALVAVVVALVVLGDPHWRGRILTPGNEGLYSVSITVPDRLSFGSEPVTVPVVVNNPGRDRWSTGGERSVQLGIRWLSPGGDTEYALETHPLPVEIGAGGTVEFDVRLVAPVVSGSYTALWDLVIDREVRFAESTGTSFTTRVRVTADRVPGARFAGAPLRRREAEVSRPRIWREAVAVWASRPFSGVGTGNFGAVASSRLGPGHQRVVHAHDLLLESLADWGVPGGLLLPLMVVATVGSMIAAALRRQVAIRHVWIVGAAVVLAGWSVVEWVLPFSATGGLFWLVGGLWWSVDRRTAGVSGG